MSKEFQLGLPLPLDTTQAALIRKTLADGNYLVTPPGSTRFEFCDQLASMGLMTKVFCRKAMKCYQFSVSDKGKGMI